MGVRHLEEMCTSLIARGLPPATPAAVVAKAATPQQRVIRGTVANLASRAADAVVVPPALTVIGSVVGLELAAVSALPGLAKPR